MANYRVTSEGTPRVTSEGRLRAIDTPFEELSGSTGLAIGLAAQLVGSLVLAGSTALQFNLPAATLTAKAGASSSTVLSTALNGTLSGKTALTGTTGLSTSVTGAPVLDAPMTGQVAWSPVTLQGDLVGRTALTTASVPLSMSMVGSLSLQQAITGTTSLTVLGPEGELLGSGELPAGTTSQTWDLAADLSGSGQLLADPIGLSFGATAELSGLVFAEAPVTPLMWTVAAEAELVGYLEGSLDHAWALTGQLGGRAELTGTTEQIFLGSVTAEGIGRLYGDTGLSVQMTGTATKMVALRGATALNLQMASATLIRKAALTGNTSLAFSTAAPSGLTQVKGFRLREVFLGVYEAREKLLTQLSEKNRKLGDRARERTVANSTAITGLTTRVTTAEGSISTQAQQITQLDSKIGTKITTFVQGTQPSTSGRTVGDIWIDTSNNNRFHTWDGSTWAVRNLDAGVSVFAQPAAPSGVGRRVGDLWFDTDDNNKQYRWDGSQWSFMGDARIDAHATAISNLQTDVTNINGTLSTQSTQITNLQSSVNAKTSTFAQPTAPSSTGRVTGDTWIDTDDGNKLYTWNGSWELRQLDAGVSIFAQPTAPTSTGRKTGDLWYDTDDGNRPYRWDGFNWAAIDDARVVNTANAVQTLTTRVDTQDGKLTNIEAKWNVTLDVNGYISGVESINNGSQATFTVRADVFRIISPGAAALTPFEVRGGTTYIKDAAIERLTIGKLTTGTLNADMQMGTGRIIYDNGTVMLVNGVGFGSTNQFIEWFGPRQTTGGLIDLSKCTEALATSYKKTNGDTYFGGSLSAGVLKNAAQSTQVSSSASVETGQFGSNGGARVVTYSLNYTNGGTSNTNAGAGPTGVTVTLQRSVNGGSWTTLASFNATGAKTAEWDAELGYYAIDVTCGGSATFTDNSGGLGPINYRAVLSNPSGSWPWINQGGSPGSQSLTVISVEE